MNGARATARARPAPQRSLAVAAALLPGALAGAHLGCLLFFLNPELRFGAATVSRAAGFYAMVLAAVSLLVHAPWVWGARRRGTCFLPWSLTAVLLATAVLVAAQASKYAYYLPPAINQRLLRAALWLALLGVVALFTALAHALPPRPYGRRSRWAVGAAALLSLVAVLERRASYRPTAEPAPAVSVIEAAPRTRLLVVGLDGATLDAILPLAEQGRLPFLGEMLSRGAYARLRSFTPSRVAPLWTSLATGKRPHRHGVRSEWLYPADFVAPAARLRLLPAGTAFREWALPDRRRLPIGSDERRARALWEVLTALGARSGAIGWPDRALPMPATVASLPAAFFAGGTVATWPPGLAQRAAALREVGPGSDPRLQALLGHPQPVAREALQADLWREAVALDLASRAPAPEALFVRLPGLGQVSRRWFGGYVAHELEGVGGERAARSAQLVADYYRHLDDAVAALWRRNRSPRLLAVVSPHGVAPPGAWRRASTLGRLPVEGVLTGRADGVLLLLGDGVRQGALVSDAAVEDVVPTLLYALGLPLARDLDGRALTAAFDPAFLATRPLRFVATYEGLGG
jgi:hypothetical protein